MGAFKLNRLSHPDTLKEIEPRALLKLLEPHRAFFNEHGLDLPAYTGAYEIAYPHLSRILMSPPPGTPEELATALFYIQELSNPQDMEFLLDELARLGQLQFSGEPTPADVAVRCWQLDPVILRRHYDRHLLSRPKAFEYHRTKQWPPTFLEPTEKRLRDWENDLNDWFENRRRGRNSQVVYFVDGDKISFLIRHGAPFKREGRVDKADSASVFYQPEKHDVLIYDRAAAELRISILTQGERKLYIKTFGRHFLGCDNAFEPSGRYTLEPLRNLDWDSLACSDIDGLEQVRLQEMAYEVDSSLGVVKTLQADDLSAFLISSDFRRTDNRKIIRAKFHVAFSNGHPPRTVIVNAPGKAQFSQDQDSAIFDEWLKARGFIQARGVQQLSSTNCLWTALETIPNLTTTLSNWKEALADDFPIGQRFLRITNAQASTFPCPNPGGENCPRRIVRGYTGKIIAVCQDSARYCEDLELEARDIQLHRFDVRALSEELAMALTARKLWKEVANGLWCIGNLNTSEGQIFFVYLLIAQRDEDFKRLALDLTQLDSASFFLLALTPAYCKPWLSEYLRNRKKIVYFLQDTFQVDETRRLVSVARPLSLIKETAGLISHPTISLSGDYWVVHFEGKSVSLKKSQGLTYLNTLLFYPGRSFSCSELVRLGSRKINTPNSHGDPILDDEAYRGLKKAYQDLRSEADEAKAQGDLARVEKLNMEIYQLEENVTKARGLDGKDRRCGDDGERQRKAVANAIRRAIANIGSEHAELNLHLKSSLKYGRSISYNPVSKVEWHRK